MKELALKTPTKDAKAIEKLEFSLLEDAPLEESSDTVDSAPLELTSVTVASDLDELRKLFVGDVDVTEGSRRYFPSLQRVSWIFHLDQEPLLVETKQRFVLFPIKYTEVRVQLTTSGSSLTLL